MENQNEILEGVTPEVEKVQIENVDIRKEYELKGTEDIIEGIPTLNYLKLTNLKHDMQKQLEMLESSKKLIDSLESMSTVDELGKKVAIANILGDKEYREDTKIFTDTFEDNRNKILSVLDAIDLEMKKYDDIQKGTKFYTDLYIDNLKEVIEKLTNSPKSVESFIYALDAFTNRTSVEFIKNYTKSYAVCDIKMNIIKNRDKCIRLYLEAFSKLFTNYQIGIFEKYISEKFENDDRVIKTFLTDLGKIINKEKQTGKYNYVKVLVMNVVDIVNDTYDLDGGKEYFDNKILELYEKYK
jgi:hypothetical protein